MPQIKENLLKAIAVTAELTGTELSIDAARMMAEDLSQYPEELVFKALTKCRRELKSRMSLADVISRIDDGRPGPEEAWAMIPKNESGSVVWTQEMAEAYGVCCQLINDGDTVQARMAFLEAYRDRCAKARDQGVAVTWIPSLGHDPHGREQVLVEAVEKGRLTASHAEKLLPYRDNGATQLSISNNSQGLNKLSLSLTPGRELKKA
ncbi:hypothetical protein [Nitrosomonas ureae]|uniref:Uncharacterized protein n=1 Tax=Nitrosomonas ureae TaxID=44577 RepID=A0A1H2EPK8_9PROT|nr:hypothetical protein [Nitrosomonas ureae]ALQ51887.1 hypothetical protein ATY38_12065 [Nitrosomonas ureae]SDT97070.1 hypothetical protein SAMN05216406_11458 [Nitrosomonas ureae]